MVPVRLPVEEHASWAEDQGRGLAARFGGDKVQNIDRVMRLPGPLDLPDAGKQARGREPALVSRCRVQRENLHARGASRMDPACRCKAKTSSSSTDRPDKDEEIAALQDTLPMAEIRAAKKFEDLPTELQQKLHDACDHDPELAALWGGEPEGLMGDDATGSGWRASLGMRLCVHDFTAVEYARLLWIWAHAVKDEKERDYKITSREVARIWIRLAIPFRGLPVEEGVRRRQRHDQHGEARRDWWRWSWRRRCWYRRCWYRRRRWCWCRR